MMNHRGVALGTTGTAGEVPILFVDTLGQKNMCVYGHPPTLILSPHQCSKIPEIPAFSITCTGIYRIKSEPLLSPQKRGKNQPIDPIFIQHVTVNTHIFLPYAAHKDIEKKTDGILLGN